MLHPSLRARGGHTGTLRPRCHIFSITTRRIEAALGADHSLKLPLVFQRERSRLHTRCKDSEAILLRRLGVGHRPRQPKRSRRCGRVSGCARLRRRRVRGDGHRWRQAALLFARKTFREGGRLSQVLGVNLHVHCLGNAVRTQPLAEQPVGTDCVRRSRHSASKG
eukprot:scaffold181480_cov33-Tisochrysis_lutea.AAC.2